jgi:hypothetical protein
MSDITDRIRQHFEALGTREIPVPEWGISIYATPVTAAERTKIYAGAKGENDYEVLFKVLLVKARDREGRPLFTLEDKAVLLQKADSSVLIRVAAAIMNADSPPAAELKN